MTGSRRCAFCDSRLLRKAFYCNHCGAPAIAAGELSLDADEYVDEGEEEAVDHASRIGFAALFAIAVVCAIVGAFALLRARDGAAQETDADVPVAGATPAADSATPPPMTLPLPSTTTPSTSTTVALTIPPTTVAAQVGVFPPAQPGSGEISEHEAVWFVVEYYALIAEGRHQLTWQRLTDRFRADRGLTYSEYVASWRGTSVEVSDFTFEPGPGDAARVWFDIRSTTADRVVEQRDEIILVRAPDGSLRIDAQRRI